VQSECLATVTHRLVQLRSDQHMVVPYECSDEINAWPNPIQWVQKKNQTSSRIEYGGDADGSAMLRRCSRVMALGPEETGELDGSDDGAFKSGLYRGGRRGWDRCRQPRPPSLSRRCLRFLRATAVDTFLLLWRGWGNPSVGVWIGMVAWPWKP
jgi:hypothetical protein